MVTTDIRNAEKLSLWIRVRGGIAVWNSADLSDPGFQLFTPADNTEKPHWKVRSIPVIVIDPSQIIITEAREVRRFHVTIRRGAQGYKVECTDFSSEKIFRAVERAGEGAYYEFDYDTQEAVIMQPFKTITLSDFIKSAAIAP